MFISDKNVETCKSRTQILADSHKKWLWQNGSTLASHARGPGFESWARHSFLLLLKTSKSDKNVETKKINKSADAISSFIKKEKTLTLQTQVPEKWSFFRKYQTDIRDIFNFVLFRTLKS